MVRARGWTDPKLITRNMHAPKGSQRLAENSAFTALRPQVVGSALVGAVGILGTALLLNGTFQRPSSDHPSLPPLQEVPQARKVTSSRALAPPPLQISVAPVADPSPIERRVAELATLAMNDDVASLNSILSELDSPEREIRKGALEAAIQFGDRSHTIPRLSDLLAQTDDSLEKAEIAEAIEYLKLPSLTEYLGQRREEVSGVSNRSSILVNHSARMTGILHSQPRPTLSQGQP